MGMHVVIGKDCPPKQALGVKSLLDRVSQARRVERLAADWQRKDPSRTFEQIFITRKVKDPHGVEVEEDVSLSALKWEFSDMQEHLTSCATCKANVASERFTGGLFGGFGCYVELPTPIPKALEEALIEGAKSAVAKSKIDPAIEFLNIIAKTKVTGAAYAKHRAESAKAFESKEALSYTYGGFLGKHTVTTDQLLEALTREKVDVKDTLLIHHFLENTHEALALGGKTPHDIREQVKHLSSIYAMAAELNLPVLSMR